MVSPLNPPPFGIGLNPAFGSDLSRPFGSGLGSPSPYANALLGSPSLALSLLSQAPSTTVGNWIYVRARFGAFMENLKVTAAQLDDGTTKQAGVRACLNRHYYGVSDETANSILIGSWGKATRVRPSRDVDILFLLPTSVYTQYQSRTGNRQSALLQEVKNVLLGTYRQTSMRADGQVVVIPFNQTPIEVAPGFRCTDGSIIVCDTNNGGRYITSTAEAEEMSLSASDTFCIGNTRALARMMKQWQREQNLSLKSFLLERLALEFLQSWPNNQRDYFWYDWMVRDFFGYLIGRANGYIFMPGTNEAIALGDDWLYQARRAYKHAVTACEHEYSNYGILAGQEWQAIFGSAIPLST
ncbi:SMODS domain-containing nucleotidyltransferase [Bradyrhizobium genosp. P]|uniref:SMODS domain-containing nucleotidyltransferase n=1 Tax=Bradyrhizobium genosp. P TaxID=83641 RepID=UPI003CFA3F5F